MKLMKRILAGVSALALVFCASACGGKTDGDKVVATVNGTDITAQNMRYYLINTNYQIYSVFLNEHPEIQSAADLDAQFSWDAVYNESTGETYGEYSRRTALETAIADAVKAQKAEELGLTLSEEDLKDINEYADNVEAEQGDNFPEALAASGLTSKEDFVTALIRMQTVDGLDKDYESNPSKYITNEEELAKFSSDSRITAKHILVSFDYTNENGESATRTADEALARANEIKAKLDNGEDFNALMEEYNDDPGETSSGYTFGKGEMVPEFEKAAFALKANEVSDIVETTYGYHIIKRVIGYSEVLEMWKSQAKIKINERAYKNVPLQLESEKPYDASEDAGADGAAAGGTGTETAAQE